MKLPKEKIIRVNLKLPQYLHQKLMLEKARTYKSIQLLIEESIISHLKEQSN